MLGGIGLLAAARAEDTPSKLNRTITIVIDYGDGVEKHFTKINWEDGMTVAGAMRKAQAHPRGIRIELKPFGSAGSIVTSIDGEKNAGAGKKNWLYFVNDELAMKAFDKCDLAGGDRIRWVYTDEAPKYK
jgi:hypothetical protein